MAIMSNPTSLNRQPGLGTQQREEGVVANLATYIPPNVSLPDSTHYVPTGGCASSDHVAAVALWSLVWFPPFFGALLMVWLAMFDYRSTGRVYPLVLYPTKVR